MQLRVLQPVKRLIKILNQDLPWYSRLQKILVQQNYAYLCSITSRVYKLILLKSYPKNIDYVATTKFVSSFISLIDTEGVINSVHLVL